MFCLPYLPTVGGEPDKQAASIALAKLAEALPRGFPEVRSTSLVMDSLWWFLARTGLLSPTFDYAWDCLRMAALGPRDFAPSGTSYFGQWLGSATRGEILDAINKAKDLALTAPPPPPSNPDRRMYFPDEVA